jgi:potassium-transporting ATPase KdpC subunit
MKLFRQSLILTGLLILLFGVIYPVFIWGIGQVLPDHAAGRPIEKNGRIIGFENIGQKFSSNKYFWGRPSAVNYNAASTGGSNLGPTNPDYLASVHARIDSFLVHNPGVAKSEIPSELVTASGSGIDPHISPEAALIQVRRVAKVRGISEDKLVRLVQSQIEKPYLGFLGTERINILKLNLALDQLN